MRKATQKIRKEIQDQINDAKEKVLYLIEYGSNGSYWLDWSDSHIDGNLSLGEWRGHVEFGEFYSYSGKSLMEIKEAYGQ